MKSIENLEEDIFGSMSDDSEKVLDDPRKISKLNVSDVYDADSDSSNKDIRESNSKSIKVSNVEATERSLPTKENNKFVNCFDHMKTKKKKRKKSKEEKTGKHHHHHHNHNHNRHHSKQQASVEKANEILTPPAPAPPVPSSPPPSSSLLPQPPSLSLPSLDDSMTESQQSPECENKPPSPAETNTASSEAIDIVTSSIAEEKEQEEKVKFNEDNQNQAVEESEETVHERAVQSISDETLRERAVLSISNVLADTPTESVPDSLDEIQRKSEKPAEEKTDVTISQEETEDAVAAILGESSAFTFNDCYPSENNVKVRSPPPSSPSKALQSTDKDEEVPPSLQSVTSPLDNSFVSVEESQKSESVENLLDDSESDSVFKTPCGQSPDVSKLDSTLDTSEYESVLDITVHESVTNINAPDAAILPSIESAVRKQDNELVEESPRSGAPCILSPTKVEGESVEVKLVNNIDPKQTPMTSSPVETPLPDFDGNLSKNDTPYHCKLPNNIEEKLEENVLPSILPPKKITCAKAVIPERKTSLEDIKCNGPSLLNVSEIEKLESKSEVCDSSLKSNDNTREISLEPVESSRSEEAIRMRDEVKMEARDEVPKLETSPADKNVIPEKLEKQERKIEVEAALKQKLPIPAQQNTEMGDQQQQQRDLDLVHDSCEVNEANKENIVKTIKNPENLSDMNDDTKLSSFLRSNKERDIKEISRSVEDDIFKSNDFSRCNHKSSGLEKIVQRIQEVAKRTTQKSEETPIVGEDVAAEKSILSSEEEMTAEILLKISESSVIQNSVNYNCVAKSNQNRETTLPVIKSEIKLNVDIDSAIDAKKVESLSSGEHDFEDEMLQDFDGKKFSLCIFTL